MRSRWQTRLATGAVAGTMLLAACGGSDGGSDATPEQLPAAESPEAGADGAAPVVPAASGDAMVDLFGEGVVPEADITSNLLPDVVIDDVTNGRKVNFRNLVPREKPILLWMYAPH